MRERQWEGEGVPTPLYAVYVCTLLYSPSIIYESLITIYLELAVTIHMLSWVNAKSPLLIHYKGTERHPMVIFHPRLTGQQDWQSR